MEATKQYALITGGSEGIGYELAKIFAENGYNLVLVSRDQQKLDRAAQEIQNAHGGDVITISKDLFDVENAFKLYDEVTAKGLQIDVLVNDAGQGQFGEFAESDLRRQLEIINLNVSSLVALTHLFLNDMIDRGEGRILNLSSIASKMPGPWQSVYHGTKAFVQSFTEAVRQEVKDKGITVTALLPGATETDFFNKAEMQDSKIVQEGLADPAKVARDGYDALMSGDDKVISGFKNKAEVTMMNMMPDETVAKQTKKMQEPVSNDNNK
jgi:short-subunit dehydrogenase